MSGINLKNLTLERPIDKDDPYVDHEEVIGNLKVDRTAADDISDNSPNKLHLDSLRDIVENFSEEEAQMAINILAQKYSDYMFDTLKVRYDKIVHYFQQIRKLSNSKEFSD